jgi:hypothetical protein
MLEIGMRFGILVLLGLTIWLLVTLGRYFVERQRRLALSATPAPIPGTETSASSRSIPLYILAFSSADCQQCHRLQTPALQRVVEARKDTVTIVDIDATTGHSLVQTYHILTVPSTVLLDVQGKVHAVNYGFASTQHLLAQVDAALAS